MLRLSLLGTPSVERDGVPATFDTRKAVALLALLVVEDRPHSRERLAALFWPDSDDNRARSALRRTLSVTSAAVGDVLVVDRAAVGLRTGEYESDVDEFRLHAGSPELASLVRAAQLYRDDFLAGFTLRDAPDFDDWTHFTADGLRQQFAGVLEQLVEHDVAAGALTEAIGHTRRWLALDPLHEPAHQALIRLQAWTGQRSAALQQYRLCVHVLDRELGVGPLPATRELADAVRTDRLAPPPGPTAGAVTRATTPHPAPMAETRPATPAEPPLVGRETALAAIDAAIDRLAGTGRVLHVTGQVGIGKTRLLAQLAHEVHRRGGRVVAARCHERERTLAYGLVVELLRAAVAAYPALAGALSAQTRTEIARLVPELAGDDAPPPAALDGPGAVTRLYAAVGDALVATVGGSAAGPAGVVIIDDAHTADEPSAELLAYLLRRLSELPLLFAVGAVDDPSGGSSLLGAMTDADLAERVDVVWLDPLNREGVAAVMRAGGVELDSGPLDRLQRETGGLPVLVVGYARAWRSAADDGAAPPPIPADVRSVLTSRLAEVAETTRQVIAAAAVLGSRVDLDLLRTTSGRGEAETVDAVEDAVRAGLLAESESTATGSAAYDFPYAALRHVVDEQLGAGRRRLLHGRAADALLRRPGQTAAGTIGRHLHEAGRLDEASRWYWQAGLEARALFAHVEALDYVEQARALGHPAAESHVAAGEVLTTLGRYSEALSAYEAAAAALAVAGTGSREPVEPVLAAVEHRLADVHDRLGDYEVAEQHARAALDLLEATPDADPALVARVLADQAVIAYRQDDDGRALATAQRALAAGRETGDAAASAQALDVLGMLALRRGDLAAAESFLTDSLAQARTLTDPSSAVAALNNLSRLHAERDDVAAAVAAAREALAIGNSQGDRHRIAALHTNLADLLHASGGSDEAMAHLKEAAALFAAVDHEPVRRPEIWKLVQW